MFTPTQTEHGDPTTCHCCGLRATGIGIGGPRGDNKFLCPECITLIERIKEVRRFDPYELMALDGGVDAIGAYLESIGKTDLAEMDEIEAQMIVKAAWRGCADRLHKVLREGIPF